MTRLHANTRLIDAEASVDTLLDLVSCRTDLFCEGIWTVVLRWIGDQQYSYSALQIQSLSYLKWMMNAKPGNMQAEVTRPVDIGHARGQDKDEQEQCQCSSSRSNGSLTAREAR